MMEALRDILETLVPLLTILLAGYFVAHTLVLGRFYNWLLRQGHERVISELYSEFRRSTGTVRSYYMGFIAQVLLAATYAGLAFWAGQGASRALLLLLPFPLLVALHSFTGFSKLEVDLLSGQPQKAASIARFLRLNTPIHVLDALAYAVPTLLFALLK